MPRSLVRIVEDPEGHIRRRPNWAEIHQVTEPDLVEQRRDDAVLKMRQVRAELELVLASLSGTQAFRGDQWSVMHVLWHLGAQEGGHLEPARRIVEDGVTELERFEKRDDKLREATEAVLRRIHESIAFAQKLTQAQLLMHARKGNREHYVVGIIEETSEHYFDHLEQIRDLAAKLTAAPSSSG